MLCDSGKVYIFICDNCRSHRVKVANCLLPAEACACLFSSLGNTNLVCVHARVRVHTTLFSHPASSPALAVLFYFHPLTPSAGNKHWVSLSSLRSSFRSRGSGGWENAVQECQALSRKPNFYFSSLSDRNRFLFLCRGHKQPPGPLSFLCAIFHGIHVGWEQRQCVWGLCIIRRCRQTRPMCSCLPFVFASPNEGTRVKAVRLLELVQAGRPLSAGTEAGQPLGPDPSVPGAPGKQGPAVTCLHLPLAADL